MKIVVIGGNGLIGSKLVNKIHVPPALIQPIPADDAASDAARIAIGLPLNGTTGSAARRLSNNQRRA